jgi:hypothetical protein
MSSDEKLKYTYLMENLIGSGVQELTNYWRNWARTTRTSSTTG